MTTVVSEIAGIVIEVTAVPGAPVGLEDTLVILESMKMEIPVLATASGTIRSVQVNLGDSVNEGDVLVVIAPA